MKNLIQDFEKFHKEIFEHKPVLFKGLADSQRSQALFITCSDSRIDPNFLTQTEPGYMFILRNAGNLVPAYGAGGTTATIEFGGEFLTANIKGNVLVQLKHLRTHPAVAKRLRRGDLTLHGWGFSNCHGRGVGV